MTMTITDIELDCTGEISLGALSPATVERLSGLGGEWLELAPEEAKLVSCHVQPGGKPTLSALPAELIAFLDALTPEERDAVPGGTLLVRDRAGSVVRMVVSQGEIHVQWPREDWSHAEPVELESALRAVDAAAARISGQVRLSAPPKAEDRLVELVGRFEGLYPEGDVQVEREGGSLCIRFEDVNVGPEQLLKTLRAMAEPLESLEGELEVGSFVAHAQERDFRLALRRGMAKAVRPALWPAAEVG